MAKVTYPDVTKRDLLEGLCYSDPRNPMYADLHEPEEPAPDVDASNCFCDNCFYGRSKFAHAILEITFHHTKHRLGNPPQDDDTVVKGQGL